VIEKLDCALVGVFSFGFLVRLENEKNPLVLHAYDMNVKFIGVVSIETIHSARIKKIIQLSHDLFSFEFEDGFKIIRCKFVY
jgi:hypothetical protein